MVLTLCYKLFTMEERIKQEIEEIETSIESWEGVLGDMRKEQDYDRDEWEDLFNQIRTYRNYKKALEAAIKGFPYEIGSY